MFGLGKIKRERDDYAKRWIEANDRAAQFGSLLDDMMQRHERLQQKYGTLNHRFAHTEAQLRSAREANSRYFYELSKFKPRPQLVVLDCGEYEDTTGRLRRAWSIWLDGVRLYTTSVLCDWAEQPERLWLTKEALERALGVKAMKAKAKRFDSENVGGGPRKLTPLWLPSGDR